MKKFISIIFLIILFCICANAKRINVKRFGALGNGKVDDTEAIQRAAMSIKNGDVLYFPKGVYNVLPSDKSIDLIKLNNVNNVTIKGRKAVIKVLPNALPSYNVIKIHNCNQVLIKDLILQGDRLLHDYTSRSGTHEFGYGIYVLGDSKNNPVGVTIENCNIYDMTGDAIVTKNGVSTGVINICNCQLHHCRRQGISILDSDQIIVDNCSIFEIGTSDDILGTAPMAGIDIEPRSGTMLVNNVKVQNSSIYECDYISIVGDPKRIEVYNSLLEDMSIHKNVACDIIPTGKISNVHFKSYSNRKLHYNFSYFELSDCIFDIYVSSITEIWAAGLFNCVVNVNYPNNSNEYYLTIRSRAGSCTFNNINIVNSNSSQLGEQDKNIYQSCNFVFYTSPKYPFKNCFFRNCTSDSRYSQKAYFSDCKIEGAFIKNPVEFE